MTLKRKNADGTWSNIIAGGGSPEWGNITGTLSNQTDLTTALNEKVPATRKVATIDLQNDITVDALFDAMKSKFIDMLYPVDSHYVQLEGMPEPSSFGGTWEIDTTYDGKAIWCDSAKALGTSISAGLPNIKGAIVPITTDAGAYPTDAFTCNCPTYWRLTAGSSYDHAYFDRTYSFNAANGQYNSADVKQTGDAIVYGKSDTVQPPAISAKVWKRTA